MPVRIRANFTVRPQARKRKPLALLAGMLLLLCGAYLVWQGRSFGRYAFTGFLWAPSAGVVISPARTSRPVIQFAGPDGAVHQFKEDYWRVCGQRLSFCFVRDFNPGQIVPVIYEPAAPDRAFVHDWALTAGVLSWFLEAGVLLLLALMMCAALIKQPLGLSVRIGEPPEA
jgi:hypothetical protein